MKEQIILTIFAAMGLILVVNSLRSLIKTGEVLGTPPVPAALYTAGKIGNIAIWGAFVAHLLGCSMALFDVPVAAETAGFVIFICGSFFVIASFLAQGINIRMGTSESNELLTSGIYRVSRNPMYVGFALIDIAALVYTMNPLLCVPLAAAIYAHHAIAKAEESFLSKKFGASWERYAAAVRRYI